MRVLLAQPRGFCAGVVRAIDIVERGAHKIWSAYLMCGMKSSITAMSSRICVIAAPFSSMNSTRCRTGAITVFSAHGVAKKVQDEAVSLGLPVIDATCPLVAKVHAEGRRYAAQDREIVLIGHAGHAEVEGTIGQIPAKVHLVQTAEDVGALDVRDGDKLAYVTQTTLSVDDTRGIIQALQARFPTIQGPDVRDICYATQNRQQAVRDLAQQVDVLLVVGSRNSSNSNRLRELGEELGCPSYLIDDEAGLRSEWFVDVRDCRRHGPAPRPRKCWCRACSTVCAGSAMSRSASWPASRKTCVSACRPKVAECSLTNRDRRNHGCSP